jgi:RES domain-containing protein
MKSYRLSRAAYANDLSGKGSSFKGARWNSIGIDMIYTAESRALAMAEVMVHFTAAMLPADYMMVILDIPDDLSIQQVSVDSLPPDWNVFPYLTSTQSIGDSFIRENRNAILLVPSAVVQGDFNLLLNPHHPEFKKVTIQKTVKFPLDNRFFHFP